MAHSCSIRMGRSTTLRNLKSNGTDSFTYSANGIADSNVATVTITVTPVNDAPVAAAGSAATNEDAQVDGQVSTSDVDGDLVTFTLVGEPGNGDLLWNADGTFTYTPDADFNGTDSFTFKANDGTVDSNVATVLIEISAVNDAPVLSGGTVLGSIPEASNSPAGRQLPPLMVWLTK